MQFDSTRLAGALQRRGRAVARARAPGRRRRGGRHVELRGGVRRAARAAHQLRGGRRLPGAAQGGHPHRRQVAARAQDVRALRRAALQHGYATAIRQVAVESTAGAELDGDRRLP